MGTAEGNYKRKLNGFYENEDRKRSWSNTRKRTNQRLKILNYNQTIVELSDLNFDVSWFESQLLQFNLKHILKLLSIHVSHLKVALKYLKQQLGTEKIKVIACTKRNNSISKSLKTRLQTDLDLKKRYLQQLRSSKLYYKSKGELRLKA